MKQNPWFWGALGAWMILGTAATAWALLWGPWEEASLGTTRFEAHVNGSTLRASFRAFSGDPVETSGSFTTNWEREGWIPFGDGRDFAADFLGVDPKDAIRREMVGRLVRIHLYRRGDVWRVLGLYRSPRDGILHSAVVELPESALKDLRETRQGPAGMGVPECVETISEFSAHGFEGHVWRCSRPASDLEWLVSWSGRKGFHLQPRRDQGKNRMFLARRGPQRYLLAVSADGTGSTTAWCTLP